MARFIPAGRPTPHAAARLSDGTCHQRKAPKKCKGKVRGWSGFWAVWPAGIGGTQSVFASSSGFVTFNGHNDQTPFVAELGETKWTRSLRVQEGLRTKQARRRGALRLPSRSPHPGRTSQRPIPFLFREETSRVPLGQHAALSFPGRSHTAAIFKTIQKKLFFS